MWVGRRLVEGGERAHGSGPIWSSYTPARRTSSCSLAWALVPGTSLLDIACGSRFAASVAAARGATVAGLDAAEPLLAIARARTPAGDFRAGDMFALPFDAASFDVATSFNGIWKGCEKALEEARRVLRPGGSFGMTFWGRS